MINATEKARKLLVRDRQRSEERRLSMLSRSMSEVDCTPSITNETLRKD